MERIERLDLDQAQPGIYAVRSASDTVYILNLNRQRGSQLMRSTGPGAQSAGWWDNDWVPFISVESTEGEGVVVVGSRAKWRADPVGPRAPDAHRWLSRAVTGIERWDPDDLETFLAARADQKRVWLDEVLDDVLPRWAAVLERLGDEGEPEP